jgi:hypothetical protein
MFGDNNCSECPIPLYGNNVTPLIMCHFNIPKPWSSQQHGITKIYQIVLKYSEHSYVGKALNIYLQIFNQTHWFCDCLIYHPQIIWCRFRLWKRQGLNLNCSMMILTLKPPSSNTTSIVFFPIYTWIIAM